MKIKLILLCVGFIFYGTTICSQEVESEVLKTKFGAKVIYLVNNSIIANEKTVEQYKDKVEDISILLEKPNKTEPYYSLSKNGILFVKLKTVLENKTQKQLNTFFGLKKDSPIFVNGYALENKKYFIAVESIYSINIIYPNSENNLKNKTLDILLYSRHKEN